MSQPTRILESGARLACLAFLLLASPKPASSQTAGEVVEFFSAPQNLSVLDELEALGVRPRPPELPSAGGHPLEGKTFVFTGKFERFSRSEAQDLVRARGGRASGSVSKSTDYLVAGAGGGTKLAKARKLGRPVLTEDEFAELLGE